MLSENYIEEQTCEEKASLAIMTNALARVKNKATLDSEFNVFYNLSSFYEKEVRQKESNDEPCERYMASYIDRTEDALNNKVTVLYFDTELECTKFLDSVNSYHAHLEMAYLDELELLSNALSCRQHTFYSVGIDFGYRYLRVGLRVVKASITGGDIVVRSVR